MSRLEAPLRLAPPPHSAPEFRAWREQLADLAPPGLQFSARPPSRAGAAQRQAQRVASGQTLWLLSKDSEEAISALQVRRPGPLNSGLH